MENRLYACRKKRIRLIFFARNVERNKYDISVNVKRIISISFNIIVDNVILKVADYMESFEPELSFIAVSRAEISAWPIRIKSY